MSSPLPHNLCFHVSQKALLLYVYALAHADETGVCKGVLRYSAEAGLIRDEWYTAIKELEEKGYVRIDATPVPIAEIGELVVMGSRWDMVFLQFSRPLRAERMSPISWARLRTTVFRRDDYTCQYCGERGGDLECDHVDPISAGGTNELGNLVTACRECNRSKRSKQLDQWRIREST